MRGSRPRFASRLRARAWLGVASLLGLLLIQPVHRPMRGGCTDAAASVGATLACSSAGSHAAEHDAGTCQVCRAASQVRAGLRAAVQLAVSPKLLQPLHARTASLPGTAPALRDAWPRAPPAAHSA